MKTLNYLVMLAEKNQLEDKVYAVYTSPLKALSNDIHKNLIEPLDEIYKIAEQKKYSVYSCSFFLAHPFLMRKPYINPANFIFSWRLNRDPTVLLKIFPLSSSNFFISAKISFGSRKIFSSFLVYTMQ